MALGSFFGSFDLSAFFNALILGVSIASIWLIAALGLTIIYGTAPRSRDAVCVSSANPSRAA